MAAPLLELRDLSRIYERRATRNVGVQEVSLRIPPGEILGLLGPNGAGKTTLLKMLALIMEPTAGDIYFDGVAARSLPRGEQARLKRLIGYLPETPFVFNLLTGREYLQFVGEIYGSSGPGLGQRIEAYLERLELTPAADQFVRTYSQGMTKKLALAASLIGGQSILLLDEPTNSLDPRAITLLKEILREERAAGKVIILSTHILDIAERLANRAAVLHHGRLVAVESLEPDQAGARPARSRLEEFFLRTTS